MKQVFNFCIFCCLLLTTVKAQVPDHIYSPTIKTVKFTLYGNQLSYPVIALNSSDRLALDFDDVGTSIRNYSYTFLLCNADWTPAILSQFDYISGFSQVRISTYRNSSIAFTKYIHYQAVLPDRNCLPTRSGNYLLKVFLDGDTSKTAFTRRMLVIDQKSAIGAQIQQPFNGQYFRTGQKIQLTVNTQSLNLMNAIQQVHVYMLQNYRWDNALKDIRPTFVRQTTLEYNSENDCVFPGGREYRWLDLRSFRLQSDRVEKADYGQNSTTIYVKPDIDRSQQRFVYYRDNNGLFTSEISESVNPLWQADYASVRFRYVPPGNTPYANKDLYMIGELSNNGDLDSARMQFNEQTGMYETSLMLKQGYYNYSYVTTNKDRTAPSFDLTEGNFWDTENTYTILVYYRPLGGRADELVGYTLLNSLTGRPTAGR